MGELSQLFPVVADRVTVFHKSVVDWLTGAPPFADRHDPLADKAYLIDIASAQRQVWPHAAVAVGRFICL